MGREIMSLTWPVIVEMLWVMGVTILVTAMVGHLGPVALAAVGLSSLVQFSVAMIFAAAGTGAAVLVAQACGAGDWMEVRQLAGQALLIAVAAGVAMGLMGYQAAPHVFRWAGAEPAVEYLAVNLFRVTLLFTPWYLTLAVGNALLRGAGKTRQALVVTAASNTIALGISYFLIHGGNGWAGIGADGAAWGSGAAHLIGGAAVSGVLWRDCDFRLRLRHVAEVRLAVIRRILAISLPAAVEQLSMQGGRILYTFLLVQVGTIQFAAHQIAVQVESLSFMPGFAFSVAAMTLVGQYIGRGEGEQARNYAWMTNRIALLGMSAMGLVFFVFADSLTALFIQDPGVQSWGATCVRIAAFEQPTIAITYVLGGALRGAGDTRWPMLVTTAGVWGVRMPLVYGLIVYSGAPITVAWMITVCDYLARSLLLWRRFNELRLTDTDQDRK